MAGRRDEMSPSERKYERQLVAEETYRRLRAQNVLSADDLVAGLQGGFGSAMDRRYGGLIVRNDLWKEALALASHKDARVAFRASWALEWAYFHGRDAFAPYVAAFLENFLRAANPSVHRHYTKMLYDMLRREIFIPNDFQAAQIAEKTFDLLIGEGTKSAVRIWAAEILYELSPRLDWVREHLEEVLRHQIETIPTPAILNHYGKLLKRMAGKK